MLPEETECAACEQGLLASGDLEAAAGLRAVREHLAACAACADFYQALREVKPFLDRGRVPGPSGELVEAVLAQARRLRPVSAVTRPAFASRPAGLLRVVLGSLAVLPLVVLIDGVLGWALFEFASALLPRSLAFYCVGLFAAWVSLGVSLSYASLPFLSLLAARTPALLEERR